SVKSGGREEGKARGAPYLLKKKIKNAIGEDGYVPRQRNVFYEYIDHEPRLDAVLRLFFFQAEDGIRDWSVPGVQTCALPIYGCSAGCLLVNAQTPCCIH